MIKLCYVCTGNTCRSVMAERLTKMELKKLGVKNIKVSSRGINATGENIAANAKSVLKRFGASGANRKSVKLGKLDSNTLYVTMTQSQKNALGQGKVISLGSLIGKDIQDPYGQSEEIYFKTAQEIYQAVKILLNKMRDQK